MKFSEIGGERLSTNVDSSSGLLHGPRRLRKILFVWWANRDGLSESRSPSVNRDSEVERRKENRQIRILLVEGVCDKISGEKPR